jgi:hypothetical protein
MSETKEGRDSIKTQPKWKHEFKVGQVVCITDLGDKYFEKIIEYGESAENYLTKDGWYKGNQLRRLTSVEKGKPSSGPGRSKT